MVTKTLIAEKNIGMRESAMIMNSVRPDTEVYLVSNNVASKPNSMLSTCSLGIVAGQPFTLIVNGINEYESFTTILNSFHEDSIAA